MDMRQTSTKNMGDSTHTFKKPWCYSTHSTHNNKGPVFEIGLCHPSAKYEEVSKNAFV